MEIMIRGARLHNLKNLDVSIPKNKLVVATGISGSGKSTLMFDIVFEEGRKQYLQSLGVLAGLDDTDKFDSLTGIAPAIAVQQNTIRQSNPLSTVGSRTKILSILAFLYSSQSSQTLRALRPSSFLYNAPDGMCMNCSGRGAQYEINMDKLVPDEKITLRQVFEKTGVTSGYWRLLEKQFASYMNSAFCILPEEIKQEAVYGHYTEGNTAKRSYCLTRIFQGRLYRGEDLEGLYAKAVCPDCDGFRVGREAREVFLNDRHIGELSMMTISELHAFLHQISMDHPLTLFEQNRIKDLLIKTSRLQKFRLGHLSLYREIPSLSGGELQRLFLFSHLESNMDSIIYVLDEPTAGLHQAEKAALIEYIKELKQMGNTVIVVEHDKQVIQSAEHIIDFGPLAGDCGGTIVYQGDVEGLLDSAPSITGQYLSGKSTMPIRSNISIHEESRSLWLRHVKTNNLQNVTVRFPLNAMIGIAGLSGSGKSSLVSDTLLPLLRRYFRNGILESEDADFDYETILLRPTVSVESLDGVEHLSGCVEIAQAPIGKKMNSNPITYIGLWDKIRKLFASQSEAIQRRLTAGHFSFNSKGACGTCGGSGFESMWLGGNLKLDKVCNECQGKRFNQEALSISLNGKNIYEVLEMSVSDARSFFRQHKDIHSACQVMEEIGMGYIKLGQPTSTLSGGEAQRIKLAKELWKKRKGNILYVLDEPTTGLSAYDTSSLISLLDRLVQEGNSVIVIEHDVAVLATCDWIIEMGPGGGSEGGTVVATGTPAMLKNNPDSVIGRYL